MTMKTDDLNNRRLTFIQCSGSVDYLPNPTRRFYVVDSVPRRQLAGDVAMLACIGMAASVFVLATLPWAWWLDNWSGS